MPVLGMFGNAMRTAQRRPLTPEEEAAMQQAAPAPGAAMQHMNRRRPLIGGQMMQQPQQQQPAAQPPSMWDGIAQDPLAFLLTGADGVQERQQKQAAQQAAQAQEQRMMEMARSANLDPGAMLAMYTNPEKFGESYAKNYEAANVGEGDVRYFGNGKKPFAGPPKTGDDIRQVGNSILQRQQDGSWKPVYTAATPQEAARAFSMFIDKKTGRQMFLMSDGQTKDTGIEAYIPTQITSVGGVPTAVDKRTLETSALSPLGEVAGNKAALASAEVQGKAQGQAAFDLPGIQLRTQTAISSIDELKKLNLNSRYGAQSKIWAVPGTEGADVQARITQVTSQAFLNAFDQLKGAGAITETEGAAATAAITRLKDQNITVGEALTAMEDLQDYYAKGLAVAKLKARQAPTLPDRQASGVAGASDDVSDLLEKYK